jgi:hypothetical protein
MIRIAIAKNIGEILLEVLPQILLISGSRQDLYPVEEEGM